MNAGELTPKRALLRLQQLAREERAAIAVGDVDLLCRIAQLLPAATQRIDPSALRDTPGAASIIADIQAAHAAAEAFLTARMKAATDKLQQYAATRRTIGGYGRAGVRIARLDNLG